MLTAYQKLIDMMTHRERQRFWLLVVITFMLTFFEVGSVVSILPFLRLVSEPDLIETVPALTWIYETAGFESRQSMIIWAGIAVFFVTVFGLILKMITIWVTTRFALMRSYSFSARLLSNYLNQPYEWFLSRHTSELGNSILSEVDRVVSQALLPAIRVIPEVFTVVLLVIALCLIEPEIALGGAVLLGGIYGLIYLSVRRFLAWLGVERLAANRARFHVVQEATGGAKELKLMGLEEGFLTRFRHAAFRMARAQTLGQVIANIPRQAIEAIAFGGMIVLILLLLTRSDGDIARLVPTLGLIAAVGLRLIPALQQIYSRIANLRQTEATLERIHADITGLTPDASTLHKSSDLTPLALTGHLELDNIVYRYPETEEPALRGTTLTISANSTIGIVGGTGAGKTTLVDVILGLLHPATGEMRVNGVAITAANRHAWQRSLGYVPQTIFLTDGTIAENIAFGLPKEQIDMERVAETARIAALHDFVMSELPNGFDTLVGERGTRLSGGQRQRVGIARALYHDPSTLIFDEATSALDTLTETAVMEAVDRIAGQKTIIMIAHRLSTVRNCDTIFLMRAGLVGAEGTFEELADTNEEFSRMAAETAPKRGPDS